MFEPKLTVNFNNLENFKEFYANSLSKNINSYLNINDEQSKKLNECLSNNIILLLNKNSIRASSERLYEDSASQSLIETSLKCFEIFNQNPEDFDFKKATKLYNSYFFSIIDELTNIFPYPYNPSLNQEDPDNIFLPNLNYSSKNFTFKKSIDALTKNYLEIDSNVKKLNSNIEKIGNFDKEIQTFRTTFNDFSNNYKAKMGNLIDSNKKINHQHRLIISSKFWKLIRFFDKFLSFFLKK